MLNITFSFQLSCPPGGSALNTSIPTTPQPYKDKTSAAHSSKIAGFMGLGHRTFHLSEIIMIILLHLLPFLSLFSTTEFCICSSFSHCFIKISLQCSLLQLPTDLPNPLASGTRLQIPQAALGRGWAAHRWSKPAIQQAAIYKSFFET